jgi:sucrose-phosphate synthase
VQVKYVVELAKTLSQHPMVHRVDLLTRLVQDPQVHEDYGAEEEQIGEGAGEFGGSYIRRVRAGNPLVYLPKEQLWPHVRECALATFSFL